MARSKVKDEDKIVLVKVWVKKMHEQTVIKEAKKLEDKYKR